MPLPPALLKRLANRGLVGSGKQADSHPENEEIIAEDYDEMEEPSQYENYEPAKKPQENLWIERMKTRLGEVGGNGYRGCPNKYNIFHKCSVFCVNRWGDGSSEPSREYLKRKNRLLKKYPLPKYWVEMYDHGCTAHYYWNTKDDTVSWLPPTHPKSQLSKSAAALRRELEEMLPVLDEEDSPMKPGDIIPGFSEKDLDDILSGPNRKRADSPPTQPPIKKQKNRDLDKVLRHKESRRHRDRERDRDRHRSGRPGRSGDADPLDPMDPAAYSDIPRGKWSDGLNAENSKTGVDSTASGPLFQMRPYPSPGAILAANARNAKGRDVNSGDESDEESSGRHDNERRREKRRSGSYEED